MSDAKTYIHNNAIEVIEKFGGIRPMATKLGIAATTVQGWKKRGVIPKSRVAEIIKIAELNKIHLGTEDISAVAPHEAQRPAEPEAESIAHVSSPVQPERTAQTAHTQKSEAAAAPSSKDTAPPQEERVARTPPRPVKKPNYGAWVSAGAFMVLLVALVAFLMPVEEQTYENTTRLSNMEEDVRTLKAGQKDLEKEVEVVDVEGEATGSKFNTQFEEWKKQAGDLGTRIDELKTQTQEAAAGMVTEEEMDKWRSRLENVETQLSSVMNAEKMQQMTTRFNFLQETESGQEQLDAASRQLTGIVDSLDGRLDLLDEALVVARENSTALGQTFEGMPNEDLKAGALLLALNQFRGALNRGNTPFTEDLELLYTFVGEDNPELRASLDKLAPQAESGVISVGGLSNEFRSLAGEIVVSSLKGEDVSVSERAQARMNDVLKIEKNGEIVSGTETQRTVQQAQEYLDEGNLNEAFFTLKQLDGNAALAAAPFMEKLEAGIAAQDVKRSLNNLLGEMGVRPRPLDLKNLGGTSALPHIETTPMIKDEESGFVMMPHKKTGPHDFSLPGKDE